MINDFSNKSLDGLDLLRGLLAIVVCLAHAWQIFIWPVEGSNTFSHYLFGLGARFAVLWFFCISGYVIALSISKNKAKAGVFMTGEYFAARAFRILPPLLFVIIAVYFLEKALTIIGMHTLPEGIVSARSAFDTTIKSQFNCISTLCASTKGDLTGGLNGPLWSLQIEIQLYVIIGLTAAVMFSGRSILIRGMALLVLMLYIYNTFDFRTSKGDLSPQILWYLVFACGAAAFWRFRNLSTYPLIFIACTSLVGCASLMLSFDDASLLASIDSAPLLLLAQLALGIACTAMMLLIMKFDVSTRLAKLGAFSYTLYIIHFPLLLLAYFVLRNSGVTYSIQLAWVTAISGGVICVLIAKTLAVFLENPRAQRATFTRWKFAVTTRYLKGLRL